MKKSKIYFLFLLVVLFGACGKSGHHEGHDMTEASDSTDSNKALYDQVMELHDEVMGKGNEIYKLKTDIQYLLTNTPGLPDDQRKSFEQMVAKLDSADRGMMDWMHKFNPSDSLDEESMREYLETEIEKMKRLRDYTNEALQEASEVSLKK